jgi:hypothetical protein
VDRGRTIRNVVIIAALAAAVDFLPQGGRTANTVSAVLQFAFAAGLALFAGRMYLEHRVAIHGLGDRDRAILYGAVAVGAATIAAQPRMFQTAGAEFVWFVLLGGVIFGLFSVYRRWRAY